MSQRIPSTAGVEFRGCVAHRAVWYPDSQGEFMSTLDVPELRDRLVYCQTLSKTYAMTGWRVGYVIATPPVASAVACVHRTFNGPVNSVIQRAALTALRLGPAVVAPMVQAFRERRDRMLEHLRHCPLLDVVPPRGTFYAFPCYRGDISAAELTATLFGAGVAVRLAATSGGTAKGT